MAKKGSGGPIPKVEINLKISPNEQVAFLEKLKIRFEENSARHKELEWSKIELKLDERPEKVSSLYAMESTGGEPDVIGFDKKLNEYIFCDCSEQSPSGRRSICYDGEAQQEREKKGVHPAGNAIEIAKAIGIDLLDEDQYRALQKLGEFDTKTQSWIRTPAEIRELGGALFADRRYDQVFVYHNSAPSFYAARGFRGILKV